MANVNCCDRCLVFLTPDEIEDQFVVAIKMGSTEEVFENLCFSCRERVEAIYRRDILTDKSHLAGHAGFNTGNLQQVAQQPPQQSPAGPQQSQDQALVQEQPVPTPTPTPDNDISTFTVPEPNAVDPDAPDPSQYRNLGAGGEIETIDERGNRVVIPDNMSEEAARDFLNRVSNSTPSRTFSELGVDT